METKKERNRNILISVVAVIVTIIVVVFSCKDAEGCPKKMAATQESSVSDEPVSAPEPMSRDWNFDFDGCNFYLNSPEGFRYPLEDRWSSDGDEWTFEGLKILDTKDDSVLLATTGRLFVFKVSAEWGQKRPRLIVLADEVLSYRQEKDGRLFYSDFDQIEHFYDWKENPAKKPAPTGKKVVSYRDDNFEFEEIEEGKEEFYTIQKSLLKEGRYPKMDVFEFTESDGVMYNKKANATTCIHLPKQWRYNTNTMRKSIGLMYVAYSDRVVTYHFGEIVNDYRLPYSGKWRLINNIADFSCSPEKGFDLDGDDIETVEEIRRAITSESILLMNEQTHESWAFLDSKLKLIAKNVQDYDLRLNGPDESGEFTTILFWMDSEGKVYLSIWEKELSANFLIGKGAIAISKGDVPGFLVRRDNPIPKRFRGGHYIVSEENWTRTLVPASGVASSVSSVA
ncbi:hypothetical protein IKF04_00160 [Candidatus Saccharibacteria bacterium]|nr:hypothetical protein [Candidatus Saccharibacteria bacterium]